MQQLQAVGLGEAHHAVAWPPDTGGKTAENAHAMEGPIVAGDGELPPGHLHQYHGTEAEYCGYTKGPMCFLPLSPTAEHADTKQQAH